MHLVSAMRYIERNPLRVGAVTRPEQYRWSSARAHVTGKTTDGIPDMKTGEKLVAVGNRRDVLRDDADGGSPAHHDRTALRIGQIHKKA